MLNLSATGRPERTGNPSYTAQLLLVVGSEFPAGVGRPELGRPEGAGFPRYRTQLLLVQASGFPGLGRTSGPRTSGGSRKSELYGSDFSGIGFRISELVGRPVLGRPEEAGCPRHWFCLQITADQWRCGLNRK